MSLITTHYTNALNYIKRFIISCQSFGAMKPPDIQLNRYYYITNERDWRVPDKLGGMPDFALFGFDIRDSKRKQGRKREIQLRAGAEFHVFMVYAGL